MGRKMRFLPSLAGNGMAMQQKDFFRGQVAVETLMAVIIMLFLLLVVTFIGLQQSDQAMRLQNNQEKSTVCGYLANAIETANNAKGQINLRIDLSKPVWLQKNSITFSPDRNDYYCYFEADVSGSDSGAGLALGAGSYTVRKNSARQVIIAPYCVPLECGTPSTQGCGTFSDGCGGEIYCGPSPCPSDSCGQKPNGCGGQMTCDCPTGKICSGGICTDGAISE